MQWLYALDLPEEDDGLKYFSLKTVWNVRRVLLENGIDRKLFEVIGDRLAEIFEVDTDNQRLDSVHIQSNMKKLGRKGIVVKTIKKFLRNLKRQHPQTWQGLDSDLWDKYMGKDCGNVFSRVKPSASAKTLKQVCRDLLALIEQFRNTLAIRQMNITN